MRYQRTNITILLVKNNRLYAIERTIKTFVIKGADKGSPEVVWDREDYIKEAGKQLGDSEVYEKVPDELEPLVGTINGTIEKL